MAQEIENTRKYIHALFKKFETSKNIMMDNIIYIKHKINKNDIIFEPELAIEMLEYVNLHYAFISKIKYCFKLLLSIDNIIKDNSTHPYFNQFCKKNLQDGIELTNIQKYYEWVSTYYEKINKNSLIQQLYHQCDIRNLDTHQIVNPEFKCCIEHNIPHIYVKIPHKNNNGFFEKRIDVLLNEFEKMIFENYTEFNKLIDNIKEIIEIEKYYNNNFECYGYSVDEKKMYKCATKINCRYMGNNQTEMGNNFFSIKNSSPILMSNTDYPSNIEICQNFIILKNHDHTVNFFDYDNIFMVADNYNLCDLMKNSKSNHYLKIADLNREILSSDAFVTLSKTDQATELFDYIASSGNKPSLLDNNFPQKMINDMIKITYNGRELYKYYNNVFDIINIHNKYSNEITNLDLLVAIYQIINKPKYRSTKNEYYNDIANSVNINKDTNTNDLLLELEKCIYTMINNDKILELRDLPELYLDFLFRLIKQLILTDRLNDVFFRNMLTNDCKNNKQCNKYKIYLFSRKNIDFNHVFDFYEINEYLDEDDKNKIRGELKRYISTCNNLESIILAFGRHDEVFWNWLIHDMSININDFDVNKCNLLNEHKNKIISIVSKNK